VSRVVNSVWRIPGVCVDERGGVRQLGSRSGDSKFFMHKDIA